MTSALAQADDRRIARPLKVLVPLIKEDLAHGKEAAERAGMPYYQAAGEKLIEAKAQLKHGEFTDWVKRNFSVSIQWARQYMALAEHAQKESAVSFSTMGDFIRKTGPDPNYNTFESRKPSWHEPVKQIVGRLDTETLNLKREDLKRQEERDAQRALGLQLIDIGYKVLARELHPDKGGSREAMARLNAVRDRLKQNA
jgi:hypothetical protein